ncbi:ParB/RepB/Spo0J family partition protein [Patescibacteria group bacterium]|nr:ParB/RepB/Spo0J family partition protein [Patescibacteria group bacterium]
MENNEKKPSELQIDQLQPNPLQPRGSITPDTLQDLVESIKEHGVLEPLIIAHTPAGYQIIAGERRWRAAKIAGLSEVPVILKETTPRGMLEMALVENVQRTDLNPIERGKAFQRLVTEFNLTTGEVSKRIGKSASFVSNTLRILTLPDALKDGVLTGMITEGHARALAAIEDEAVMIEAYKIVLREAGSVRRAEELARRMKKKKRRSLLDDQLIVDKKIDRMQEEMTNALGERSRVSLKRSRVETKLAIVLKGTPTDTEKNLKKIYKAIIS